MTSGENDPDDVGGDPSGEAAAALRDQAGRRRDLAALTRDRAGQQRDREAELRDHDFDDFDGIADTGPAPAGGDPDAEVPAASVRDGPSVARGASDRAHAQQDRVAGAADRSDAASDRAQALADRTASARDRHHASRDSLTGLYTREAGLQELERDLARVTRTGHPLVLAFVDVDHLKSVNDRQGHAAGDQLLRDVADSLSAALRPYDLIVRYGGDEFLCAVQGIDLSAAVPRFARVNALLALTASHGSVTVGLARFDPAESWQSLIARADADLYEQRRRSTGC